jgi:methylmalonyl-CoA/ethylmalonyl-CoA epimerase
MKLHHIGKVVSDLEEAVNYHKETFGLEPIGGPVVDPAQNVEVQLLDTGYGENVTIELIKPVDETSPVYKFLKKGGGLHHLSYEVTDIGQAITDLREKGALVLGKVVPSKRHGENPSAWLYTRSKELIELIEKK